MASALKTEKTQACALYCIQQLHQAIPDSDPIPTPYIKPEFPSPEDLTPGSNCIDFRTSTSPISAGNDFILPTSSLTVPT